MFAGFLAVFMKVAWDTLEVQQIGIEAFRAKYSGSYLFVVQQLVYHVLVIWVYPTGFLMIGKFVFGPEGSAASKREVVTVMLLFSAYAALVYICGRVMINRCLPYNKFSLFLIPFMVCADMFLEMVFIDFDVSGWPFWVICFFDVSLLIMRDAGLWVS